MIQHRIVILLFLGLGLVGQMSFAQSVREYLHTNEHRLLSDYFQLLSLPNVASDTTNIRRNADFLVERMQKAGLKPRRLEVADRKVSPAVYGEYNTAGAVKTIIFYAHYDGQPTMRVSGL